MEPFKGACSEGAVGAGGAVTQRHRRQAQCHPVSAAAKRSAKLPKRSENWTQSS